MFLHLGQEVAVIAILGFDLARSGASLWLLLAPLCVIAGLRALAHNRRDRRRLVSARLESRLLPGHSPGRARSRVLLAGAGALFMGLALLGPVRGFTLREVERKGVDIVLCVDTSRSMLVKDLDSEASRLKLAQRQILLLLDSLAGDRVALLAFSGDVREVAPLTRDKDALRWFLGTLGPEDNRRGGTDLGLALEHALDLFDGRTGAHEAIVLLTDGEDLEGRGLDMAREAAERGIRVYVVGMGSEAGGKIPDGQRGFVKDSRGQEVVSKLDGSTLRAIAEATGGVYLSARTPLALERIHERHISQLEGQAYQRGKEKIPHDRFQWPLALALACMFIEVGLRDRKEKLPVDGRGTSNGGRA